MYVVEFAADKIPGVDSTWDTLHTFVRIPAGAMLAMSTVGDATPALELSPAIMGGGLAATSHATKSGHAHKSVCLPDHKMCNAQPDQQHGNRE